MNPLFTRIKGTLMIQIVKLIRTLKNEELDSRMTDKEQELLGERILPTSWYSGTSARHMLQCLCEVVAKGNVERLRQWGRNAAWSSVAESYREFLAPGNPVETLNNFSGIFRSFIDSRGFEMVGNRAGFCEAVFSDTGDEHVFTPFTHLLGGWIEGLIGLAGGEVSSSDVGSEQREGKNVVVYRIAYDPPLLR